MLLAKSFFNAKLGGNSTPTRRVNVEENALVMCFNLGNMFTRLGERCFSPSKNIKDVYKLKR